MAVSHVINRRGNGYNMLSTIGKLIFFIAIIICQPVLASLTAVQTLQNSKFIGIADIHFDPFSGCEKAATPCPMLNKLRAANYLKWASIFESNPDISMTKYYHDTNYVLLKSTLTALKEISQIEQPKFVIMLGDYLAHEYRKQYIKYSGDRSFSGYKNFVKKTLQFLMYQIAQTFPQIDVYPMMGNNDTYSSDYKVVPNGEFLKDTTDTLAQLIKNPSNLQNFLRDFPNAGYYAVNIPTNSNQRIIILDTMLFAKQMAGNKVMQEAAKNQLRWLHQQLLFAAQQNQRVLIAFHIPDSIDVYATFTGKLGVIWTFWQPDYYQAFRAELKEFAFTVMGIFPAHIHLDAFQRIDANQNVEIPVMFTPSISPIFGNNPGFKIYAYDEKTLRITNIDMYYFPLAANPLSQQWQKEYSFERIYQSVGFSDNSFFKWVTHSSVSLDSGSSRNAWLKFTSASSF